MDFAQFKSVLLTGLSGLVVMLVVFVYSAQAAELKKATADIVEMKLVAVELKLTVLELKGVVLELKRSNDNLTDLIYERFGKRNPAGDPDAHR